MHGLPQRLPHPSQGGGSGGGDLALSMQDIITNGGGGLAIIMTLVQISPLKVNPWTAIAKAIGRAMGIEAIEKKLDAHITMDDRRNADGHRARILHFNNELLRDIPHTKEEFTEALSEIDAYEKYCVGHPDYPNTRAALAIENILETYQEHLKQRDFLQESSEARREKGT